MATPITSVLPHRDNLPAVSTFWLNLIEIFNYLETGEILPPPPLTEKLSLARLHFEKSLEWKSEPRGIYEMRRHFNNYFKGLPDFKEIRLRLLTSQDVGEIKEILNLIESTYVN